MASIRKRGHRWEVRIRRKNKPTRCKTFTSKADALSWANKTEYLIETEAHTITSPTLSLSGAAARYIDEHMCRHKGAESAGYRLRNIITALGADKASQASHLLTSPHTATSVFKRFLQAL